MSTITIVTHDGWHHADDAFAVAMLKLAHPDASINIVRTRDPVIIDPATVPDTTFIVDVGYRYDGRNRFDHHQPDAPTRSREQPYAAAGLVWKTFGTQIVSTVDSTINEAPLNADATRKVTAAVDDNLILDIDLIDNGRVFPPDTHLSSVISMMNNTGTFDDAMHLASKALTSFIAREIRRHNARDVLSKLIDTAEEGILVLEVKGIAWEDIIHEIERPNNRIIYVVNPSTSSGWGISAVSSGPRAFASRLPFPPEWLGRTGTNAESASGLPGLQFVHKNGFYAVATTRESAINVARKALRRSGNRQNVDPNIVTPTSASVFTGSPLIECILQRISIYAAMQPETTPDENKSWESWYHAAFDLLTADVEAIAQANRRW